MDSTNQVCDSDQSLEAPFCKGASVFPGALQFLARFILIPEVSILVSNVALPYILAWTNYGTLLLGSVTHVMTGLLVNGAVRRYVTLHCSVEKKPI